MGSERAVRMANGAVEVPHVHIQPVSSLNKIEGVRILYYEGGNDQAQEHGCCRSEGARPANVRPHGDYSRATDRSGAHANVQLVAPRYFCLRQHTV